MVLAGKVREARRSTWERHSRGRAKRVAVPGGFTTLTRQKVRDAMYLANTPVSIPLLFSHPFHPNMSLIFSSRGLFHSIRVPPEIRKCLSYGWVLKGFRRLTWLSSLSAVNPMLAARNPGNGTWCKLCIWENGFPLYLPCKHPFEVQSIEMRNKGWEVQKRGENHLVSGSYCMISKCNQLTMITRDSEADYTNYLGCQVYVTNV